LGAVLSGCGGYSGADDNRLWGTLCIAVSDDAFCAQRGKDCGLVTYTDNCGQVRCVSCGTCAGDLTCAGAGVANVCGKATVTAHDACPAPRGGVQWDGKKRFLYGTNFPWLSWGGDFGGVAAWNVPGVDAESDRYDSALKTMKTAGANVIRWWMFPRLFSDGLSFNPDNTPAAIGGSITADVATALRLADANDVYLILTLFSFDNFRTSTYEAGIYSRSIGPMVVDPAMRARLLDNLVRPLAQAVEASPYKKQMIAWEIINEPEWAMAGADKYGGSNFIPQTDLDQVTHDEMESFVNETSAVLRAHSSALITIGGASIKWANAWTHTDIDFYELHYYDWMYQWYPYPYITLQSTGLTDKPVVLGEYPEQGLSEMGELPSRTPAQFASDLWAQGYAGALSWAFNDPLFRWDDGAIKDFGAANGCETSF